MQIAFRYLVLLAAVFSEASAQDDRFFAGNEGSPTRTNMVDNLGEYKGSRSAGGYEYNTARRQGADYGRAIPLPEGARSRVSSQNPSYQSSSGSSTSSNDNDPNTFGTSAYYLARQDEVHHTRNSDGYISFFNNGRYYWITDSQQKKIDNIRSRNSSDYDRQVSEIIDIYSYDVILGTAPFYPQKVVDKKELSPIVGHVVSLLTVPAMYIKFNFSYF